MFQVKLILCGVRTLIIKAIHICLNISFGIFFYYFIKKVRKINNFYKYKLKIIQFILIFYYVCNNKIFLKNLTKNI